MSQLKNIKRWISRVEDASTSDAVIVDALLKIRPHSRVRSGIQDIEQNGGIQCFLRLIQKPNKRILDISISILANCLTQESARKKVFANQGITPIVKLLQTIRCNTIWTRTCRSIANLATDIDCSKTIHTVGAVELIIQLIKLPSTSPECLKSALRAIKNLANIPVHRKKLIQHGIVSVIVKIWNSATLKEVIPASVLALAEISNSCTIEFADHMLGNNGDPIQKLVKLIEDPSETESKESALAVLVNLTLQGSTRPTIGNVGGLKCIVNDIKNTICVIDCESDGDKETVQGPLPENAFRLVGALCYCCREAINRVRLRSMDALPVFIRLLCDDRWISMHPFILTTLLCFVYYEEGLKVLHDNGIFAILLDKLQEYTRLERENFEVEKIVWDGHDIDETFDRRHSRSSDIPTKFNQRPAEVPSIPSYVDPTFKALTELDFDWRLLEDISPYSPQWSPVGSISVADELAFARDSSSPDTPRALSPSDFNAQESRHNHEDNTIEHIGVAGESFSDRSDSSSSRESFDQMHSPALLPATGRFNISPETPRSSRCDWMTSSNVNVSKGLKDSLNKADDDELDFELRMRRDLRQAPKRAKIDNLKESSGDRLRSRSLDTGGNFTNPTLTGPVAVPESPSSSEYVLTSMGSPKFLRFVNETCSVSPQVLKHAGREVLPSVSTSTSTPAVWKQPRKRTSGTQRKLDDVTESTINIASEEPQLENKEKPVPHLIRTSSNPLPLGKEEISSSDQMDYSAMVGPEPITSVQVVLCLLRHYCEVSDNYIVSLAQQDDFSTALVLHMMEYPKTLDPKFNRIIDKLTSCTKCFGEIVSVFLAPWLTSAAFLRTPNNMSSFECENRIICDLCGMDISSDCMSLVDNVWHNIAICHSSSYGSHLLKTSLTKGTDLEATAIVCIVLLLFLWYWETGELKSMSDVLHKRLASTLHAIADNNRLRLLCDMILNYPHSSKEFQCASYTFHKLVYISHKSLESEETSKPSKTTSKALSSSGSGANQKVTCEYETYCKISKPDRVLVFPSDAGQPSPEDSKGQHSKSKKKSRTRKKASGKREEISVFEVHGDVLSEKSSMFAAMLQGKYRESSEKRVTIQDVPYKTASYVIHCLYGCKDDECTFMKDIMTEVYDASRSRYDELCHLGEDTSNGCPVEIDIMRVMDLWLLPDVRKEFYQKHKAFFDDSYISAEISAVLRSEKYQDRELRTNTKECKEDDQTVEEPCQSDITSDQMKVCKATPTGVATCPFLNFLNNHAFLDIVKEYVGRFCSPCSYQHNHLLHGRVFLHIISTIPGNREAFVKIVLENISSSFSKLVQELKSLHQI